MKRTEWLQETLQAGMPAFYTWYRKDGGTRSYTWVKNRLQEVR